MAPALVQLNGEGIQSTSDEAPGLLTDVEHAVEAHHLSDWFHVHHKLSKAVCASLATKERSADKVSPRPWNTWIRRKRILKAQATSSKNEVQVGPQRAHEP